MIDAASEQISNQLEIAVSEVRQLLPVIRYGLRDSLENGLINPSYKEPVNGGANFSATVNIGIPPNIVGYECLSGSIIAHDYLQSKHGIDTKFANAGPKESKYMFGNDVVLVLPDKRIFRIVPMYSAIDNTKIGEKYAIGTVDADTIEDTRQGLHRIEIAQGEPGFPLSGFKRIGTYVTSGLRFNYATNDHIYLIHQTLIGKGSRFLKRISIVLDVPKATDFSQVDSNLHTMMAAGLGLPAYLEEDGLFLKGDLRALQRIEIQDGSDVSGKIKATRIDSFMRDSKALCEVVKAISIARQK